MSVKVELAYLGKAFPKVAALSPPTDVDTMAVLLATQVTPPLVLYAKPAPR